MINLVKIALEDVQEAFDIKENLFENYFREIEKDPDLLSLIDRRQNFGDWQEKTPLGGPGTSLNGIVLYCIIRHYRLLCATETGVSGGFYSALMLAALSKNFEEIDYYSALTSFEISDDKEKIGKLVPEKLKQAWDLRTGTDSLEMLDGRVNEDLYCHDSLHTYKHMLAELQEFKKCEGDRFFIYIDDQDTDDFWRRCLYLKLFDKKGYNVKYISGSESRLSGHLGGFIKYEKA